MIYERYDYELYKLLLNYDTYVTAKTGGSTLMALFVFLLELQQKGTRGTLFDKWLKLSYSGKNRL